MTSNPTFSTPAKVIKATPMKTRTIQGQRYNAHLQTALKRGSTTHVCGISSSEYSAKHPKYPFDLNAKRRRPQLSREELMALYGTGNLLSRWEERRRLSNGEGADNLLDADYLGDLLSELDDDDDFVDESKLNANLLNWQNMEGLKIPSVELSLEAEIQYENGVSLYESQLFEDAIQSFQYVINEFQYDKDAWFYVARCYEAKGMRREAREAYTNAARYGSIEALGALAVWERQRLKSKRSGDHSNDDDEDEMEISSTMDAEIREKIIQKKRKRMLMKRFFKDKYEQEEKEQNERKRKRTFENLLSMLKEQKSHSANAKEQSQTMFTFGVQNQKSGNYEQAMAYYEQAACMGNTNAFFNMACMYRDAQGTEDQQPDHLMAMLLFQKAASKSHLKAKLNMGVQLERGDHGEKNMWLAFCCFRDAKNGGLVEANSHYDRLRNTIRNRCNKRLVDRIDISRTKILGYNPSSIQDSKPMASGVLGDLFCARIITDEEMSLSSRKGSKRRLFPSTPQSSTSSIGIGTKSPRSSKTSSSPRSPSSRRHSSVGTASTRKLNRNSTISSFVSAKTSTTGKTPKPSAVNGDFTVKVVDGAFLNRWDQDELKIEVLAQSCFILSAQHENILNIHSLHFEDDRNLSFVAMEQSLCSLRQYVQTFGRNSPMALNGNIKIKNHLRDMQQKGKVQQDLFLAGLLTQVARAMKHLHSRKILHRSLSDTTVQLCESADNGHLKGLKALSQGKSSIPALSAKMTDFGGTNLTNHFDSKYDEMRKQGGIVYSAPEILERVHYHLPFNFSKQTDLYAFGVLMHFVWTRGILPFEKVRQESGYFPPGSQFYKIHPSQESEYRRILLDKKPKRVTDEKTCKENFEGTPANVLMATLIEQCCHWDIRERPSSFDFVLSQLDQISKML
eukprot:CAMPEP_0117440986 /NCGR_PEP_ID=MMETSP0759-20121206/3384_1 /TAXON_ID=63605 /ORGANISM="Percolomonas cosmopolitus, Strain WS" /LENGTH=904 /DNA_ID=CAMNT_0005232791 /DNA_START=204 /DNA_END=2915 /DNA_ORIENTATION=+